MPPAQRSVGRFCSMVTQDLASLALVDDVDLGIGAQVYVLSNQKSYRLTAAPGFAKSPVQLLANGGVAYWTQENAVNDQTQSIFFVSGGLITGVVANTWHQAPGAGASVYSTNTSKACWTINTQTGLATYSGPNATFFAIANLGVSTASMADGTTVEFSITKNGTLIGTTSLVADSSQNDFINALCFVSNTSVPIAITNGDTLQYVFRTSVAGSLSFRKYQVIYQLLVG